MKILPTNIQGYTVLWPWLTGEMPSYLFLLHLESLFAIVYYIWYFDKFGNINNVLYSDSSITFSFTEEGPG